MLNTFKVVFLLLALSGCKSDWERKTECEAKGGVYLKAFSDYKCVKMEVIK